jgi:hypothetical protein
MVMTSFSPASPWTRSKATSTTELVPTVLYGNAVADAPASDRLGRWFACFGESRGTVLFWKPAMIPEGGEDNSLLSLGNRT